MIVIKVPEDATLGQAREIFEREFAAAAMWRAEGNACQAALDLGVHRNTLDRMRKRRGLPGAMAFRDFYAKRLREMRAR